LLESPALAVYWRSGTAAGGEAANGPAYAEDLVLFTLAHAQKDAKRQDVLEARSRLIPRQGDPVLPFKVPPSLKMYTENDGALEFNDRDTLFFSNHDATVFVACPSVETFRSSAMVRPPMCYGHYYATPGLRVNFTTSPANVYDWQMLTQSLTNLISSWRTQSAD
jgi:hypothetical protein